MLNQGGKMKKLSLLWLFTHILLGIYLYYLIFDTIWITGSNIIFCLLNIFFKTIFKPLLFDNAKFILVFIKIIPILSILLVKTLKIKPSKHYILKVIIIWILGLLITFWGFLMPGAIEDKYSPEYIYGLSTYLANL